MPVTALSPRIHRLTGPGRGSVTRRPGEPALTVTVAIPLAGEALLPQAHKLIEAVRELVELSQGTVSFESSPPAPAGPGPDVATGPEVRIHVASRQVLLDGRLLPLTRLEFDLLLYLAERPRKVFTRGQLLAGVWGYEHTGERTVDVHVRRLRLKLGGGLPMITTVYGVGYRLSDDARVVVLAHD
jgi:two-component system OmpR family response regulator